MDLLLKNSLPHPGVGQTERHALGFTSGRKKNRGSKKNVRLAGRSTLGTGQMVGGVGCGHAVCSDGQNRGDEG